MLRIYLNEPQIFSIILVTSQLFVNPMVLIVSDEKI